MNSISWCMNRCIKHWKSLYGASSCIIQTYSQFSCVFRLPRSALRSVTNSVLSSSVVWNVDGCFDFSIPSNLWSWFSILKSSENEVKVRTCPWAGDRRLSVGCAERYSAVESWQSECQQSIKLYIHDTNKCTLINSYRHKYIRTYISTYNIYAQFFISTHNTFVRKNRHPFLTLLIFADRTDVTGTGIGPSCFGLDHVAWMKLLDMYFRFNQISSNDVCII
jgi:hypothetical protein